MNKKTDEIKKEVTTDENVENTNVEEQVELPQFEFGSYAWALDILIKGVSVAQTYGVYTLQDAALIQTAIDIVNNTEIEVK